MVKRCKKCGEIMPLEHFYANKLGRAGRRPGCKACTNAARRARYAKNKQREIARVKRWQQDNAERLNEQRRAYRAANPDKLREGHLKRRFGLTLADYATLLAAQGGGCAICGRPEPERGSLHVDHDHETGVVRGLLCFRCYGGLGQFDEDAERLVDAAAYLGGASTGDDPDVARARERARMLTVGR